MQVLGFLIHEWLGWHLTVFFMWNVSHPTTVRKVDVLTFILILYLICLLQYWSVCVCMGQQLTETEKEQKNTYKNHIKTIILSHKYLNKKLTHFSTALWFNLITRWLNRLQGDLKRPGFPEDKLWYGEWAVKVKWSYEINFKDWNEN